MILGGISGTVLRRAIRWCGECFLIRSSIIAILPASVNSTSSRISFNNVRVRVGEGVEEREGVEVGDLESVLLLVDVVVIEVEVIEVQERFAELELFEGLELVLFGERLVLFVSL